MWWMREYIGTNPLKSRPHLCKVVGATNIEMTGVKWMNSPYWHIQIKDYDGGYFHDFEVEVDAKGQLEL